MATARRSRTAPGEEREEEMEMQQQEEEEEEEEVCFHYPRGWARPGGTSPAVPRCPSSSELGPRPLERLSSGSERSRPRSRSRQRAAQPRYRDIQTLFAADKKSCSRRAAGDCDGARMTFTAQKCGVCFQPPSIILIYRDNIQEKTRQRIMPIRNFSRFSDCSRAAEEMKNNPRHKPYLEGVSLHQLEKLHRLLRDHLDGHSLSESLGRHHHEHTIDPEEDMNKLDDKELAKRKSIMDELFEKNRKRRDDPDFVYNVEVDFPQDEHLESCAWDEESDEEM